MLIPYTVPLSRMDSCTSLSISFYLPILQITSDGSSHPCWDCRTYGDMALIDVPLTLSPVFLLLTGVILNLYAQKFSNLGAIAQSSQIIPLVKFLSTALFAIAAGKFSPSTHISTSRQRKIMMFMGASDAIAYVLFCIGFDRCGATLTSVVLAASSQIFTAASSHFVLGKKLGRGQLVSVACVMTGIMVRLIAELMLSSMIGAIDRSGGTLRPDQWWGVGAVALAGLLYAMLGIAYESLVSGAGKSVAPPHSSIMLETSKIGLTGALIFQVLYTIPRRKSLVLAPMTASGVSAVQLVFLLAAFGSLFNIHMFAQSFVFRYHGALGVSLVNAVRGAAIAVCGNVLFCTRAHPEMCLNRSSALSAALVTVGGALWAVSARRKKDIRSKEPKGKLH